MRHRRSTITSNWRQMFRIWDTFPQPINRIGQKFGGHVSWRTSVRLLKRPTTEAIVALKYNRYYRSSYGAVKEATRLQLMKIKAFLCVVIVVCKQPQKLCERSHSFSSNFTKFFFWKKKEWKPKSVIIHFYSKAKYNQVWEKKIIFFLPILMP